MKKVAKKKFVRKSSTYYGTMPGHDVFIINHQQVDRQCTPSQRFEIDLVGGKKVFKQTLMEARMFVKRMLNSQGASSMIKLTNWTPPVNFRTGKPFTPVGERRIPVPRNLQKRVAAMNDENHVPGAATVVKKEEQRYKGVLQRLKELEDNMIVLMREYTMVRKALLGGE